MMAWVWSVVRVMWQAICGVVIALLRKEKGSGGSSPCWRSRAPQSMVRPSRRGGVPVFSLPIVSPRPYSVRDSPRDGGSVPLARLHPPSRNLGFSDMDKPIEERAGGQYHRTGADFLTFGGDDAHHPAIPQHQVLGGANLDGQAGDFHQRRLHRLAIERPVGLGPGAPAPPGLCAG